jgi:hypothetical protein
MDGLKVTLIILVLFFILPMTIFAQPQTPTNFQVIQIDSHTVKFKFDLIGPYVHYFVYDNSVKHIQGQYNNGHYSDGWIKDTYPGKTYKFVITSLTSDGLESGQSEEIVYTDERTIQTP